MVSFTIAACTAPSSAHRGELLDLRSDPPGGTASVLDAAPLVFILLLDWLLHRYGAGCHGLPVCRVHIPDVDMHVTGDRWPVGECRIGQHDYGVIDANLGMHEFAGLVRKSAQLDGVEDSLQEVNGCIRSIDDEIRRYRAVVGWLVL